MEAVRTHHLEKRLRWIHNHNENHDNLLGTDDDQKQQDGEDEASNADTNVADPNMSTSELATKEAVVQMGDDESDSTAAPVTKRCRKPAKVAQSFDIEFERLGLTLSNGTSILQVRTSC